MKNEIHKYLVQHEDIYGTDLYIENIHLKDVFSNQNKKKLNDYFNAIKDCLECSLGHTRTNFVFGIGNPESDIVFIGEAPGKQEDLEGTPFVGKSGKLLDKILAAIGLKRNDIYILNIVKCRPPNNRNPLNEEIEKCAKYLKNQLEIIKPKLIVSLGRVASKTLLKSEESLSNMRKKIHKYSGIDLIVTYHPAALLRDSNLKKDAWEDFKVIRNGYING